MAVVDLSVLVAPQMGVPPALKNNRLQFETVIRKSAQSEDMVRIGFVRNLCIHTGTHVDAPCHALGGRRAVAAIPLDRLVGGAVVLDLGEVASNEAIGPERLQRFGGDVRPDDIVILRSRWSERYWGKDEYWTDSPYLTVEGARWLVDRRPKALVFDFFEEYDARFPDFDAIGFKVHREILGRDVLIVEHVVNLAVLPRRFARFAAAPLKLDDMEGSPVRALAILD
ncbi:MAG: hypothetical protein A2X53_12685 [Candidatus Rokubacteria bacterium GWA2_70_23]|nr:MAG: hypothetical protein A2X53_12685 [Candidatus Rokubacteria bacterium GWA2_70_23]